MSNNDESDITSRLYSLLRTPTPRSPHPFRDPALCYPTSSVRDEPFSRDAVLPGTTSGGEGRPPAAAPIQAQSEVAPGVLQDGTLTVNHPYVDRYVAHLAVSYHAATGQTVAGPSTPRRPLDMAGVAALGRAEDVSTVLQLGQELNKLQSACLLALAALKVYADQHHPTHFALWGSKVQNRTAAIVDKVYFHQPRLIASPVCWLGTRTQLWLLRIQQLLAFPPERVEATPARMVLRQRKARARTTPARVSHTGKGKAVDRTGVVGVEEQSAGTQTRFGDAVPAVASGSTSLGVAETTTREEEVAQMGSPLIEVAAGVLLVAAGASGVAGDKALKRGTDSTLVAAPSAPTRRSSRQAIKRDGASGSPTGAPQPAVALTSVTPTPAMRPSPDESFPSRGSSTAVSDVSEGTAVGGEERAPVRSKKRKASELQDEARQAKMDVSPPLGANEEPLRKTRRMTAPVPDAGVVPETTNAPRNRRSGGRRRK